MTKTPSINTPNDLAALLGISISDLSHRAKNMSSQVRVFNKTVRGKDRTLIEARDNLREYHLLIQERILSKLTLSNAIHGYRRGRSNITHARQHLGAAVILRFDIQDFFPSIKAPRVHKFFHGIGADPEAADLLTRLTTFRGSLPIGFATSPSIANHVVARLIKRIKMLADKQGFTFSSYADNFEISGSPRVESFRNLIAGIFRQEGFVVNEKKSVTLRNRARKEITGVVINSTASWGRTRMRNMRARIHGLKTKGLPLDSSERAALLSELLGFAAYVKSINVQQGDRIHVWIKQLEQRD